MYSIVVKRGLNHGHFEMREQTDRHTATLIAKTSHPRAWEIRSKIRSIKSMPTLWPLLVD